MKLILAAVIAAALTAPALAQDTSALATAFVKSPVQQKLLDDMLSKDVLAAQVQAAGVPLSRAQTNVILNIVSEELNAIRPEIESAMIVAAANAFTAQDLEALLAFYDTRDGASAMSKMAPFMQSTTTEMMPSIRAAQARVIQRVQAELR